MSFSRLSLGHGIGLRREHYSRFLEETPSGISWLEVITENFTGKGGRPLAVLEKVRRDFPIVLHGVSLSIGSVDPLNLELLALQRSLCERFEPSMVSDHLCWGGLGGRYAHELLPLPFTEECLAHVVERVCRVQDFLGRQILLENVSSYVIFGESTLSEWDFLSQVAERADCGILFDVNNVFVSARNHGFDARAFIDGIPIDRVGQIHLAGHADLGTHLLDTHDHPVPDGVFDLYRRTVARMGAVPTIVEWDDHIPELEEVIAESQKAGVIETQVLTSAAGAATQLATQLATGSAVGAATVRSFGGSEVKTRGRRAEPR